MDCCKGAMPSAEGMGDPATTADAARGTPELRKMFGEWARTVEGKVLATLEAQGPLDLAALARALEVSPESALHLVDKLVRDGKATVGSIQATGARETTA